MKINPIALLIAIIATSAAAQTGPDFTFRGHKIGDPIRNTYPAGKYSTPCHFERSIPNGLVTCFDEKLIAVPGSLPRYYDLEGIKVEFISHYYLDDYYVGFLISSYEDDFSKILNLLTSRYGQATSRDTGTWINNAGQIYSNEIITWNTAFGEMRLQQRGNTSTRSTLHLMYPAAEEELRRRTQAATPDRARRAF